MKNLVQQCNKRFFALQSLQTNALLILHLRSREGTIYRIGLNENQPQVNRRCHSGLMEYSIKDRVSFKENVRYPIWICKDPISVILGTRFSLILGTR